MVDLLRRRRRVMFVSTHECSRDTFWLIRGCQVVWHAGWKDIPHNCHICTTWDSDGLKCDLIWSADTACSETMNFCCHMKFIYVFICWLRQTEWKRAYLTRGTDPADWSEAEFSHMLASENNFIINGKSAHYSLKWRKRVPSSSTQLFASPLVMNLSTLYALSKMLLQFAWHQFGRHLQAEIGIGSSSWK